MPSAIEKLIPGCVVQKLPDFRAYRSRDSLIVHSSKHGQPSPRKQPLSCPDIQPFLKTSYCAHVCRYIHDLRHKVHRPSWTQLQLVVQRDGEDQEVHERSCQGTRPLGYSSIYIPLVQAQHDCSSSRSDAGRRGCDPPLSLHQRYKIFEATSQRMP